MNFSEPQIDLLPSTTQTIDGDDDSKYVSNEESGERRNWDAQPVNR